MTMISLYIFFLGIFLIIMGAVELTMPLRAFGLWKSWVFKKYFFLHGSLLIAGGFPLTIYRGPLSTVIFIFGILAVLIGPFVLIYPDKIRQMFQAMSEDMNEGDIKKTIYIEGSLRIAAGAVCVASYLLP
jgi:uncharacterized protein YjeT (DUF2065 family)